MRIVIKQAEDKTQESALKVSVIEEPEVIIPPPVEQSRPTIAIKTGVGPQGKKGDPGVSPVVTVTDIEGGHRVTVTNAAGETVFDVMDGEPGDDYVLTEQDKSDIADIAAERVDLTEYAKTEDLPTRVSELQNDSGYLNAETDPTVPQWAKQPTKPAYTAAEVGAPTVQEMQDALAEIDVPVEDVQVNGVSIVSDGVANVPVATDSTPGVVKVNGRGLAMSTAGVIQLAPAPSIKIKTADDNYSFSSVKKQHESTFYGLAKAAGDTTQSASSNPVGTYTDDAKAAIQQMLDVPSTDDIPNVPVQDVQVNGVSVLQDGVANVPKASDGILGVVSTSTNYGTYTYSNGVIAVSAASSLSVKAGTNSARPICCSNQHESTFYGLAKAAGDTTQSKSSNAVGTYTDEAKTAIRAMLGLDDQSIVDIVEAGLPAAEGVAW